MDEREEREAEGKGCGRRAREMKKVRNRQRKWYKGRV